MKKKLMSPLWKKKKKFKYLIIIFHISEHAGDKKSLPRQGRQLRYLILIRFASLVFGLRINFILVIVLLTFNSYTVPNTNIIVGTIFQSDPQITLYQNHTKSWNYQIHCTIGIYELLIGKYLFYTYLLLKKYGKKATDW